MSMKEEIPLRQASKLSVDRLRFDPKNPRFASDGTLTKPSDAEVVRHLVENADLGELVQSVAASGYIDIEPLIVLKEGATYTVLEGNRRLAVIKLLSTPALAGKAEFAVPPLAPGAADTLKEVTVYRVESREEARDFIGFKHINGPYRWDPLAKARFAAEWYRRERKNGTTLKDIARRMGDRHDTIQRMVAGVYVLDQARKAKVFELEDRSPGRPFSFSHLYTALTRPGYRTFLGLPDEWRTKDPDPDPIPSDKLPNLKRIMVWLYGSKEDATEPVVTSQNPHVKQLGEVLAHAKARAHILAENDLASAYAEVEDPSEQFEKNLVEAHRRTEDAFKKVRAFSGDDVTLLQISKELFENAELLLAAMEKKAQRASK
jgi:hypothetical protein